MSEYFCATTKKENGSRTSVTPSVSNGKLQTNASRSNQLKVGSSEISKDELIMTLTEYKRANMELTKDKQYLRLHSQSREEQASRLQAELESTMQEMNELKQRVKALELNEPCSSFGSMGKSWNKMVHEAKNSGNESNQDIAVEWKDVTKFIETGHHEERRNRNRNEMDESIGCQCGAATKLAEVMKVNHCWNRDYNKLMEECECLRKTENQLRNLKSEFEEVKKIAFQKAEECRNKEENIEIMKQSNNSDEVVALKQQLKIYEEDFLQEKDECKKLLMENCTLKLNMQKANEAIKNISSKNTRLKEKYLHVCMEKEHIVKELKRLTNNSMDSLSIISVHETPKPELTESSSSQDVISRTARIIIPAAEHFYGRH